MNYKNLFITLGFSLKENATDIFSKIYPQANDYCIEVNFEKESINYGNLIRTESKTTQNFSQPENFVVDLINFQSSVFDLTIEKTQKININYSEIWESNNIQYLSKIAFVEKGKSITKSKTLEGNIPVVAGGQTPAYYHNESNREGNIITISASGAYAGFVNYFDVSIFASDCNTVKSLIETEYATKLIYYCLKVLQPTIYKLQRGQAQPHVYKDDIEKIKVPVFDKRQTKQALADIETLEEKAKTVVITDFDKKVENILKKYLI